MIVTRGGALSELTERGCSVSCFEPGLVIRLSPWSSAFFCTALFSLCSATRVHKKNRAMQSHFLMLPPCDCIAKIANNFVWGATFENQMLGFGGDCQFDFYSDGEKKSCTMQVKNG